MTTETQLEKRTREIREAQHNAQDQNEVNQRQEYFHAMLKLRNYFEEKFIDVLPMLAEAGITYTAHRQNLQYPHMGSYIKFSLGDNHLNMDISETGRWRYQYVRYNPNNPYGATMTYGEWSMDQFIVWITENLIKK